MKNVQLIFAIILINGLFLNVSAQEKKWETGTSLTLAKFSLEQKHDLVSNNGEESISFNVVNVHLGRTFSDRIQAAIGIGMTDLIYQLDINKSMHQLDNSLNFSDRPDFSELPYKLERIDYTSSYLNVPVFLKIKLSKNTEKPFQASLGLRMDNFFLKRLNTKYKFEGGGGSSGGNILGSIFLSALWGELIWLGDDELSETPAWDDLTNSQRQETKAFYDQKASNYFFTFSPSISFDWRFKNISYGFEPFIIISGKKVNSLLDSQTGGGIRTHFTLHF